jgi:hypothetical protein
MTPSIAVILMLAGGPSTRFEATHFEVILVSLVVGAGLVVSICWQLIDDWYKRVHGRNWPTISAVIDVVSVTTVEDNTPSSLAVHFGPYYLAKLTYSYRSPGKQMGEYSRRFGNEGDAKAWANSYKGETVKAHVDPHDPTRSVVLEEDL